MEAKERFTAGAIEALREAIEEAGGNEVFAACRLDGDGLLAEVLVAARGNKGAVLALDSYLERGDVVVHNHPSGTLRPSDADLQVAGEAGSKGVGSCIVNNAVTEVYVVAEPARRKALAYLDEEEIAGVLDSGGKMSGMIPDYEPRPSQVRLARDITTAYNEARILAAEAGTGVGKSFAYLIPSFAWAIRNEERIVISTATINLQKQLVDKDIPVVQRLFRKKTKAVLVKGRANYLCRNRLREALDEEGLLATEGSPLRAIEAWAETSTSATARTSPSGPRTRPGTASRARPTPASDSGARTGSAASSSACAARPRTPRSSWPTITSSSPTSPRGWAARATRARPSSPPSASS